MATHQSQLDSYLHAVWRKKQTLHGTSGLLAFLRWGVLLFLVGMLIDWLTYLPSAGRVVLFVLMLAVTLRMAWRGGWKGLRRFNGRNTALQIEKTLAGRESLLVTGVQLDSMSTQSGASPGMLENIRARAEGEAAQLKSESVVSMRGLKRPLIQVLALALFLGLFACFSVDFLGAGLTRLLPPWGSVKYPTRTTITLSAGDIVVKEGERALLQASISGVVPKDAKIKLRPAAGKPFTRTVPIEEDVFEYEINSAHLSFEYRVFAGDDRTGWQTVTVIAAPRIDRAEVTLTYPEYTRRASETVDALTLTVPEGTRLSWVLHLDRAVSTASVSSSDAESRDLAVSEDGMQVTMEETASSSRSYAFAWTEKSQGYAFKSPSNYLQVQPDEAPQVELTKPERNVFATLGRKLDFAYRGRDDHGIGEASIRYRVNKVEERAVALTPPAPEEQGEVLSDWDYRTVLTNLVVGDTVTFVVEMADRYPGEEGPHRMRSQARRLSVLSENDYLTRMYRQKVRLLTMVKNIYREERGVHVLVKELEPESGSLIQSCQLEVVRQELIKDRLLEIKQRMADLVEDLAANGFTEELYTGDLTRLQGDLQRIADEHISIVSAKLKLLATAATDKTQTPNTAEAVDAVNFAARELGVMVLQLGFKEATEVMAREFYTLSGDQAELRWRVITPGALSDAERDDVLARQSELADWIERLLASVPQDRESTAEDALVAFKLSRLGKDVARSATADTMRKASQSMGKAAAEQTAALQADVIKDLLRAQFRLRQGLEYSALVKAEGLFAEQAQAQKDLWDAIDEMSADAFKTRKVDVKTVQQQLSKRLALLLMPAVPAPRYRLLDATPPPKPEVERFLADSVRLQDGIALAIEAGDRDQALVALSKAEATFKTLARLTRERLGEISESQRIAETSAASGTRTSKIGIFTEQLSGILEKTEDAEAYETDAAFVVPLVERLALDVKSFKQSVIKKDESMGVSGTGSAPLLADLDATIHALEQSARAIGEQKLGEAIELQDVAAETFEEMVALLTRQGEDLGSFSAALSMDRVIQEPGPLMRDIQSEQLDMVKVAEASKDEDLPSLAMGQKNLVHAVNATLGYLDPFSHHIETGSVMLFAKEDMGAAAIALEDKDREEALDAGSFVAESMQEILDQLDALAPQYTYVMELVEFSHARLSESITVEALQKQLRAACDMSADEADLPNLAAGQKSLLARSRANTELLVEVLGLEQFLLNVSAMESALKQLEAGDLDRAAEQMDVAVNNLGALNAELLRLNQLMVLVLAPPLAPLVPPEFSFLVDFTALATQHKSLYRTANVTAPKDAAALSAEQEKLVALCGKFLTRYADLGNQMKATKTAALKASYARIRNPSTPLDVMLASEQKVLSAFFAGSSAQLADAQKQMQTATAKLKGGALKDAVAAQKMASENLRSFYVNNVLMFLALPGPPPPADPAPSYEISTEDSFDMFAPGSVSGRKVKGGKQEWQVLGRRDRAALNENFARELPLEYRGLLKDYYERLAQ